MTDQGWTWSVVYDVVYDLGAACAWTWSAKGPMKVRLETGESAVLDQITKKGWTWMFPRAGGGGLKKRMHKKAKKQVRELISRLVPCV
jgi:hypothetical protein